MEKTKESGCRKLRKGAGGEEKQSSSLSKVAKNENPVEGTMNLERMSEDASVLFTHFPEEIWMLITDKVVDSETLTNLMQASPVFRNLLLPRRVEFLYPQVWQVLGLKFEFEYKEDGVYRLEDPDSDSEVFNLEYPYLDPRTKILMLREVCNSWCRGVDEFYENLSIHYKLQVDEDIEDDETSGIRVGDWMRDQKFYVGRYDVEEFMNHFDQTHFYDAGNQRNPIINRSVSISHIDRGHGNGIFDLIEKYGHYFWHCKLVVSSIPTWSAPYTYLKEMLELLPNLKTLKVTYRLQDGEWDQQRKMWVQIKLPSEMEILQLEQEIPSRPLPKLHQLKFLSLKNFPAWLLNALVSANNHVSMLEVGGDVQEGYDLYSFPMPNLKQLSMKYLTKAEFENLNKPEVNWSLVQIYLNLRPCGFMPLSQIFSLLEDKWADTLTNVAIFTPSTTGDSSDDTDIVDIGSSKTLNLPKVERFFFSTQEISSLDFILPMKSLKILQVALRQETQFKEAALKLLRFIKKNQVVQFVGYFQWFHNSNIWNLFPNWKSFKLRNADYDDKSRRVTYTRKDYEERATDGLIKPPGRYINYWYYRID